MRLLAVDPGIGGTGWAVWDDFSPDDGWGPLAVGVISEPTGRGGSGGAGSAIPLSWDQKGVIIGNQLAVLACKYRVWSVICEFPQFFADAKGYAATSTGNIYKLACAVGSIATFAMNNRMELFFVSPATWKGQLKKEEVIRRIDRLLGADAIQQLKPHSHAYDAIGIGLYHKGYRFSKWNEK